MKEEEMGTEKDQKGGEHEVLFTCPVCGKRLGKNNLPDMKGVIEEGMYYCADTRFISSTVILQHPFTHSIDEEEEERLEDVHPLTCLIEAAFDEKGMCTRFHLVSVEPG